MAKALTEETQDRGSQARRESETMKLKVAQAALAAGVDRVLNVVPQKTTMPALGHLLIEASADRLKLTATDLDITISTSLEAEVEQEGAVTLPAKRFSEIVRQLDPEAETQLEVHKGRALVTAGRANFRILGMGPEEFPNLPSLSFKKGMTLPASTLRKAIQKTVFCVSKDETRRALTGILWEVGGSSMGMVGTDGHRLARMSVPVEIDVEGRRDVVVPTKALNQVLRLGGEGGEEGVAVKLAEDHVIFRMGRTTLFTRLIEGPFPKYEDVIPKENDKRVVVDRDALLNALRRVGLLADTLTRQVKMSLKQDLIVLSARTQDIGEAEEEVEAQYGGEPMELGYNAQYLGEVLRNIDAREVLLSLGTPLSAGLIEPLEQGEEENYLCLIMPLRLVE